MVMLNRNHPQHAWAKAQLKGIESLITCESVLSEAFYLSQKVFGAAEAIREMLTEGILTAPFHLEDEVAAVAVLLEKYRDLPISLADACLVRMAERNPRLPILTMDSHFGIYRTSSGKTLNARLPEG